MTYGKGTMIPTDEDNGFRVHWHRVTDASAQTESTTPDPAQSSGDPPKTATLPDPTTQTTDVVDSPGITTPPAPTTQTADETDDSETSANDWSHPYDPRLTSDHEDEPAEEDPPVTTNETTYHDTSTGPTIARHTVGDDTRPHRHNIHNTTRPFQHNLHIR